MKRKILITVILLTLVPSLLIAGVMHYHTRSAIIEAKQESLASIVHMMDFYINQRHDALISQIEEKADMDILKDRLEIPEADADEASDNETIEGIKQLINKDINVPILEGAIINSRGKVILSNRPSEEGLTLDKTELFQSIVKGGKSYMGLVVEAGNSEKVEIAVPVLNDSGKMIGILKQIIKLDRLKEYLGSIEIGETGYAFLIWKSGHIVFQDDKRRSIILYPEYQSGTSLEQLISDFKTGQLKEETGVVKYNNKGEEFIGAYKLVDSKFCIAVAAMEREETLSNITRKGAIIFGLFNFIVLLAVVIGYMMGASIQKQVQSIISSTRKINNGDLTARCPSVKNDVLKELSFNINNLAERLQKNERELRMSARIDSLTHLPNRGAIYEILDTLLYKHPNQALLLLELEGMKVVNANMGHDIGDRIMMEIGDILRSLPHNICYPSRLGGETFLVFVTNWTSEKYPERIAEKIIKKIEGIKFIGEAHVDIGVNIGIQYTDEEKTDKKKLIKQSDIAMRKAKMEGDNLFFVSYSSKQKEM